MYVVDIISYLLHKEPSLLWNKKIAPPRPPAATPSKFLLSYSTQCNYITHDISLKHTINHGTILMVVRSYGAYFVHNFVHGTGCKI